MALDKKKKKKVSSDGLSTKEKMLARKKQLESKGNGNGLVFPKEGTLRMRIKSPGDDQELGIEIVQFYLGGNLGGVISPATFDEPCPFMGYHIVELVFDKVSLMEFTDEEKNVLNQAMNILKSRGI